MSVTCGPPREVFRHTREPVRHDKALEPELILKEAIYEIAVLRASRAVDGIVRCHRRADAGLDGVGKRPQVQFMERPII